MDTQSYKTSVAAQQTIIKSWWTVDATNQVVGRLASQIAHYLRGKHKPYFTPHLDCGDQVIVINAEKVRFTGKKMTDKQYLSHSRYPGGQKITTPKNLQKGRPERILEHAVKGMLPKNRLGRRLFHNL